MEGGCENMSKGIYQFDLDEAKKQWMESRGYAMVCFKCKKELKDGDSVISKRTRSGFGYCRHYHEKCWNKMRI